MAADAAAQTCVGTTSIVCTYSGASGPVGDPPSGPVTGNNNLTNNITATGTATQALTFVQFGTSTLINDGIINGEVNTHAGVLGAGSFTPTAITVNHGTINGILRTLVDYGGDATVYNTGIVNGAIIVTPLDSVFGSAKIYNSGQALTLTTIRTSTLFGDTIIENSGTVLGYILSYNVDGLQGTQANTINSGTAAGITNIAGLGNASIVNSGFAGIVAASSDSGSAAVSNSGLIQGSVAATSGSGPASISNAGSIQGPVAATSSSGPASVINSGSIKGTVSAIANSGPASVINTGSIRGTVQVTSDYNGSAGPGAFLTNAGLIDGSGQYAAIDLTNVLLDARMTLNLLTGSRVIGRITIPGDATIPGQTPTVINIQGGRMASSILTFGDSNNEFGLADTGATINVTNAIYVVSGNSVAIVDPSSFAVNSRNMVDVTHVIGSLATGRLSSPAPASSDGMAIGFAPSGNVARDMIDNAFASLAYAGQDRVLANNPNFTAADGTSVWAQGFGGRRVAPEDGPTLRSVNNLYGGALGVDKTVQAGLRLGAFIGGGSLQSDLDLNAGRTTSDLAFAGLYGRYALNGGFVDFSLIGGGSGNSSSRRVDNNLAPSGVDYALAHYAGWFVTPELALGFERPLGSNLTLTPTVRVRYLAAGFDAYQENGSAANLAVASRVSHYFEERAGIALTRSFNGVGRGTLQLTGTAGGVSLQRAGDSGVNAVLLGQSLAFATPGRSNVIGYYAGANIDWRHASGASFFAATEFNGMSDSSRTITGRGGVKITF